MMPESKWITNTRVKCDKCDWEKPIPWSEVKEWHNVMCPKCHNSIIINDDDMAAIILLQSVSDIQDEFCKDKLPKDMSAIKIDTAQLRKAEAV